jgi:hypothetical protein
METKVQDKKNILIVGGVTSKHNPPWLNTFNVEFYPQEEHFKRIVAPKNKPHLIICLKSWISHKQCRDFRNYADENSIEFIISDGGLSMAIQRAAEKGLTWFVRDIDKAIKNMPEDQVKNIDETIERAWHQAYNRERDKALALEKRLKKDRSRLEDALAKLEASERRESAATRVIAEVREATKVHQQTSEQTRAEIRRVASELREKIDKLLSEHENSAKTHVEEIAELRKKLSRLSEI